MTLHDLSTMPAAKRSSPEHAEYFNDLTQAVPNGDPNSPESLPENHQAGSQANRSDALDGVPRPKRIACVVCRKRKLKCDGAKPRCRTCSRLGHECAYDEVRRKSGPKRGYVKALEARLAQVETLLKSQDSPETNSADSKQNDEPDRPLHRYSPVDSFRQRPLMPPADPELTLPPPIEAPLGPINLEEMFGASDGFTWEMISIGIDEPLPPQEVIDDLTHVYFEKIHASAPMIHRRRYLAAMNLAPNMRPPVCLRYAIWCMAASVTDKYVNLQEVFYQRARKYVEADEMRGHGERLLTIAHSQCWTLIAEYEFKQMYFPRAWMSTGRATRLAQMMGLHRLDGTGLDVKQCLAPPKDWTEREERRRTFWAAFCNDRYASIGTGWPMIVEEKDILTNLPSSEEAFDMSQPQRTGTLKDALSPSRDMSLTAYAGVILMASLFGRNLLHLHRPEQDDGEDDLNGEFWRRHREMDNILLHTSLSMPHNFRLPNGISDFNIVFLNMNIHASTICLHQAAIFKADKNRLPATISAESKVRCVTAAAEITSIMRLVSHIDPASMHPFTSFCLYVAARVFVQYLKSRPTDQQVRSSLHFLLSAMRVMKAKNPLAESFLIQLDVDLEGTGLDDPIRNAHFSFSMKKGVPEVAQQKSNVGGSPLIEIHSKQAAAAAGTADSFTSPIDVVSERAADALFGGGMTGGGSATAAISAPSPNMSFDLPNRQRPQSTSPHAHSIPGNVPITSVFPGRQNFQVSSVSSGNSPDVSFSPGGSTTGSTDRRPSPTATTNTSRTGSTSHRTSFTPPHYDDHQMNMSNGGNGNSNNSANHHLKNTMATLNSTAAAAAAVAYNMQQHQQQHQQQPQTTDYNLSGFTSSHFLPPTPGSGSSGSGADDGVGCTSVDASTSNPFVMPPGWDFDPTAGPGPGPGPTTSTTTTTTMRNETTAMTPGTEGMFTQMMEVEVSWPDPSTDTFGLSSHSGA